MGVFKVGMSQQKTFKPQHCKLPTHLVSLLVDLLHHKKAMLEAEQPGELPLMRQLSSIRRLHSLRDPTMPSNGVRGSPSASTPSWRSPAFNAKAVRHDHFKSHRNRDLKGRRSPSSHVKPPLGRMAVASPFSDPSHAFESERGWDLGMEAEESSYGVHVNKRRPSLEAHRVEVFQQRRSIRNHHEDELSLDGGRDPRWASDMEAFYTTSYSLGHPQGMAKHYRSGVPAANGGDSAINRDSYGLQKQNLLDRIHGSKKTTEWCQPRTISNDSRQHTRVLSPVILNPHEDMHYHGKSFSLERNSYARHNQPGQRRKRGFSRNDFFLSESPPYSKTATSKGQKGPSKGTWKSKLSEASSDGVSQKSASHSSLSGAWDTNSNKLEDELDVCELPRSRCGIPCYWSKSQRRGKGLLDMADKSFACGLYSKSPRRMTHPGSKNYNPQFQGGYPGLEPVPPLHLETSLLSDPSTCSEDMLGTSDSGDLNGELGIHDGSARTARGEENMSEGKELAVCREKPRSLSQKYRPKVFEDLVGQSLVAEALSNAVQKKEIAHVYLFQGPRGTGKTSAARIFAAALNCISLEQQKPCGSCKECLAYASGKSIDIREVDAASNNAVEKVKVLLQTAFLAPSLSQYKIFIIDECHMLTAETWNALLKLLEEPPRNVVFILTTTAPDKLPTKAVSRCQKFPFPKIKDKEIVGRLQGLVKLENLKVESGALELVAARADGSLRDAEIILDQLSLLGHMITASTVHELFGSASDEKLFGLLDFALCSDTVNTVQRVRELIDLGVEPLDLMVQLATLITGILEGSSNVIFKCNGGFFSNQTLSDEELERLRFALQVLYDSEKQLRAASTDRTTWLTAALLQLGPARTCTISLSTSSASAATSPVVKACSNGSRQVLKVVNWSTSHSSSSKEKGCLQRVYSRGRSLRPGFAAQVHPEEPSKGSSAASTELSRVKTQADSMLSSRRATLVGTGNLEDIWWTVLERCNSSAIMQLLRNHGKLLAVSISADGAVVFIEFDTSESKSRSERCKKSIIDLFRKVLGLSLEVKIALAVNANTATGVGARVQAIVDHQATTSQAELRQSPNAAPTQHEPRVGSLHYRRSQSQTSSPRLERANSIRSFPATLTISKSNKVADLEGATRSLGSTPRFGSARVAQFEGDRPAGSWKSKSRIVATLQKPQSGERTQEIVVIDDGSDTGKHVRGAANAIPVNVFSYDIEEENMRLESQSKYGGLLCWRKPQVEDEKVSKNHHKGGCAILMRLVPCAN